MDEGVSYYRRHPQAAPLVVGARTWELLRWKEEIELVSASYRTPLAAERRRRSGASPDCPQKLGLSDLEPRRVSCFAEEKYIFPVGRKTEVGFINLFAIVKRFSLQRPKGKKLFLELAKCAMKYHSSPAACGDPVHEMRINPADLASYEDVLATSRDCRRRRSPQRAAERRPIRAERR